MEIKYSILTNNEFSKNALSAIFNPENTISCTNYGDGGHCNRPINGKLNLWGSRGDKSLSTNNCMVARIFSDESGPVAILNIGATGSTPTLLDKTQGSNFVSEMALFVVDKYIGNQEIKGSVKDAIKTCTIDKSYSKLFVAFNPSHPYLKSFLDYTGAVELTSENLGEILGENSLHPERFRFEGAQLQECLTWNPQLDKVHHEGWHDSDPCIAWGDKTAYVLDLVGNNTVEQDL